jgi:hypothetical protein
MWVAVANYYFEQEFSTSGSNAVTITPTNFKQGTTITLNAPGESVVCMYKSSFWYVIGGEGYVVA